MPLVRIDVLNTFTAEERRAIGDGVHAAMTETLDVPDRDRFHVVSVHEPGGLDVDRSYLDIERSDRVVLVHVTLSAGRTRAAKQAFYARLAEVLTERVGIRSADLAVVLSENQREDWSFGNGEASYVVLPRDEWR
jgi:4-oxalocrotonate tautomerase